MNRGMIGLAILVTMTLGTVGCSGTATNHSLERSYDEYIATNGTIKPATETKPDSSSKEDKKSEVPKSSPTMTLYPDGEFRINGTTYFYNGLINSDTISFQRHTYYGDYFTVNSYYQALIGSEFLLNNVNVKAKITELDAVSGKISLELSMP